MNAIIKEKLARPIIQIGGFVMKMMPEEKRCMEVARLIASEKLTIRQAAKRTKIGKKYDSQGHSQISLASRSETLCQSNEGV